MSRIKMINRIRSILIILFIYASSALFFPVACVIWLLTRPFDRRLVLLHLFTCFWATLYIWIVPAWSLKVTGREKIDKKKTYMIVSNHQSLLDIIVAFGLFVHFKWVSKAEIFRIPFIGWNMVLNRYVKLKRGDKKSIEKMMAHCEETLAEGSSLYMFPEGTRSKTGDLKDFKPGAFILAHKMKIPILPVVITGTRDALPKKSLIIHGRHAITLRVLDEIPYEKFSGLSVDETSAMVRELFSSHLHEQNDTGIEPE
jgi:1-acyl-sn-glycerol-3-phosphate acyltransferase